MAAAAVAWPDARILDRDPVVDRHFSAMTIPDARHGRRIEVAIHESGQMIGLEYGSPEGSAQFVAWVLDRFPPPDDVVVQLYEWGDNPRVTAQTTTEDLLAIGP